MSTRILGPTGSKRRKRFLLVPVFMVAAAALYLVVGAQAVHGLGVFELEGNATNDSAVVGDDWDNVCFSQAKADGLTDAAATSQCTATSGVSASNTAFSWVSEPNRSTTIFTGGGSKDPNDTGEWASKNDAGGLPDKDNLRHAFASRYTATSANCGNDANGNPLSSCDVIYFGSDRFDNAGDAQQGFWFLQNPTQTPPEGACSRKVGGGTGFCDDSGTVAATHHVGDLLVISDFANGGTHQIINAYKWVASGGDVSTHLQLLAGTDPKTGNAECSVQPVNDPFCGTISPDGTPSPWAFLDKVGNTSFALGELFEAGINLSSPQINLAGECFSTVVSETRSSTSPTATLKDFVIGSFGHCTSGVTSNQSWTPNDHANITVTGKATWAGTVNFTLYDGADCGLHHGDGTAYVAGDAPLYLQDFDPNTAGVQGLAVSQATDQTTIKTNNTSVFVPSASGLTADTNGAYSTSWLVSFTSGTSGVPNSTRCEATTGIAINDNVSHT